MHTHTNEGSEREQSTCTPHRRNEKEIYFIPTTQLLSNIASCPRMYLIANGRWMMTLRFQFSPLALSRSPSSISSISRSVDLAQIKPHTKRAETRQSQKSTNLSLMKYESWAIELWPRSRNWSVRWMAPRDQFQQTNCNIVMNFSFVIAIVTMCVCVSEWLFVAFSMFLSSVVLLFIRFEEQQKAHHWARRRRGTLLATQNSDNLTLTLARKTKHYRKARAFSFSCPHQKRLPRYTHWASQSHDKTFFPNL